MLTIGLSQWGTLEKLWGTGGGGGGIPLETLIVSQTKVCDFFLPQLFWTCINSTS